MTGSGGSGRAAEKRTSQHFRVDTCTGETQVSICSMAVSQGLVLAFLLERGGRAKNCELLSAFRGFLSSSEPAERSANRDLFKKLVNNVAVVKQIDGVKYVVLKKKCQDGDLGGLEKARSSSWSPEAPSWTSESARADVMNNNHHLCPSPAASCCSAHSGSSSQPHVAGKICTSSMTARVLNVSKSGTTGAVFAVVAMKSPPQMVKPIHQALVDAHHGGHPTGHKTRQLPVTKRSCDAKDFHVVPYEPREHEWLVTSATGRWAQIYSLLLQDAQLVDKKSFISGFTVLHWAAKKGNSRMVRQILDASTQSGLEVDVNTKSHDGYTPLHLAAIHSHESVLKVLVRHYGANINVRDNSGKKPHHYLDKDTTAEVREMLGDPRQVAGDGHSDVGQRVSDVPKGLNTLSKLFQPSVGHRKKAKHRLSFSLMTEDQDENKRDYTTLNRRPLL